MKLVQTNARHGDSKWRCVNATFICNCLVTMSWMTSASCERLSECARTKFKQSQANSSNERKNYLLVPSSRSAVLKFMTA